MVKGEIDMNAERQFDRKLMGFMNRRGSLAKTIAAALACIAIGAVAALAVCGQVFADGGQTDAQGCHAMTATGEVHCHVTAKGKRTTIVKAPAIEVPARTVEIKHVRVQALEEAMARQLSRLERAIEAESTRPPRVVEVEKIVRVADPGEVAAECAQLRAEFHRENARWGGNPELPASQAIEIGCW